MTLIKPRFLLALTASSLVLFAIAYCGGFGWFSMALAIAIGAEISGAFDPYTCALLGGISALPGWACCTFICAQTQMQMPTWSSSPTRLTLLLDAALYACIGALIGFIVSKITRWLDRHNDKVMIIL
jgi:hypothetical protein